MLPTFFLKLFCYNLTIKLITCYSNVATLEMLKKIDFGDFFIDY